MKFKWVLIVSVFLSFGSYAFASENVYLKYDGIYGTLAATYGRMFLNKTDLFIKVYQPQLTDKTKPDPGSFFSLTGNAQGLLPAPSGIGVSFTAGVGKAFFNGWLYLGAEGFYQFVGGVNDSTVFINQIDEQYKGPLDTFLFYAQLENRNVISYAARIGSVLDGTLLFTRIGVKSMETNVTIDYGAESNIAKLSTIQLPGRELNQTVTFGFIEVGVGAERKIASRFSVRGDIDFGFNQGSSRLFLDNKFNKFDANMAGNEMVISIGITYFFYEF